MCLLQITARGGQTPRRSRRTPEPDMPSHSGAAAGQRGPHSSPARAPPVSRPRAAAARQPAAPAPSARGAPPVSPRRRRVRPRRPARQPAAPRPSVRGARPISPQRPARQPAAAARQPAAPGPSDDDVQRLGRRRAAARSATCSGSVGGATTVDSTAAARVGGEHVLSAIDVSAPEGWPGAANSWHTQRLGEDAGGS
jgi:hypothetical protein